MILVLKPGTTDEQTREVLEALEQLGLRGRALTTAEKPLIHVVTRRTRRARALLEMDRVQAVVPTSGPRVRAEGRRFYPYHFINWSCVALLMLGVLVLLAAYFPPGLGRPVDIQAAPLEPAGYPGALVMLLRLFPARLAWLAWLVILLFLALVFLLPTLDRTRGDRLQDRWPVLGAGLVAAIGIVYLSLSWWLG